MHARDQFMLATTVLSFVFESENIISFLVETGRAGIRATADKSKKAYSPTFSAAVTCLERPKASPSQTTLATRSTEYPFLPPRIYNPSTMSTSCAPEVTNKCPLHFTKKI